MSTPPRAATAGIDSPQPTKAKTRRPRQPRFPHAVLIFLVAATIYPLIFTLFASLKSNAQFYTSFLDSLTSPYHWENYLNAWKVLTGGFVNSIVVWVDGSRRGLHVGAVCLDVRTLRIPRQGAGLSPDSGADDDPVFPDDDSAIWIVKQMRLTGSLAAVFFLTWPARPSLFF